jgi:hypothetical protein
VLVVVEYLVLDEVRRLTCWTRVSKIISVIIGHMKQGAVRSAPDVNVCVVVLLWCLLTDVSRTISATWPGAVHRLANFFLCDLVRVTVGSEDLSASTGLCPTRSLVAKAAKPGHTRAQRVNATFEVLTNLPELLTFASISLSSRFDYLVPSSCRPHRRHLPFPTNYLPLHWPKLQNEPLLAPRFPTQLNAHVLHAAFAGRNVIEPNFNSMTGALLLAWPPCN